ncbi:hypothetical protein BJ322DRAFT_1006501 [Thelephora terrestris]|uniref:Uncharacterized protein n=1 Tax=Thelephora terrestris TaxID=56493 RepID=A0A9P6L755_9AGAM|nr:hypothetical protein BJ322DRAFT_1006501 [Thelephora terrestris]
MFSQFRNAVEHLAVQPMRRSSSQDSDTSNIMSRTNSGEGGLPPSVQLADSALSSIRRSLQAQRPSSPARNNTNSPAVGGVHDPNKPRSRLEERLRASLSFGIGEVSGPSTEVNTPISTQAPTPLPGIDTAPLSPTQTPLPDSPIDSPSAESGTAQMPLPPSPPPTSLKLPSVGPSTSDPEHQPTVADDTDTGDVSLPIPTAPPQNDLDPGAEVTNATISSSNNNEGDTAGADVEALRQQLKRFKERFTDVSSSFKRLQAEKLAADRLLQELTPLQTIQDTEGLKEYIKNINLQSEVRLHSAFRSVGRTHITVPQMSHDEIKRLNNKLTRMWLPLATYFNDTNLQ